MTRVFVVGADARDFDRVQQWLDVLDGAGCDVRLLTVARRPAPARSGVRVKTLMPAAAKPGSSRRTRMVRKGARTAAKIAPDRLRLLLSLRYGNLKPGRSGNAPHYVALSKSAAWPTRWSTGKRRDMVVVGPGAAMAHLEAFVKSELSGRYEFLVGRMRTGKVSPEGTAARSDWQFLTTDPRVAAIDFDLGDYVADAIRLATHAAPGLAQSILDLALAQSPDRAADVEYAGAQEIVTVTTEGIGPGTTAVAERLGAAADEALASGDLDRAARLFNHLLTLVFHPGLHTAAATTPIVEDPEAWLAPIRDSKVRAAILGRALPADGRPTATPRVSVLRGSYPGFSQPVVDALENSAYDTTAVVPGEENRLLLGVGPNHDVVRMLLGAEPVPEWDWLAAAESASHLFVDWADRSASLAISRCAAGRVVLRMHSVDLLSGWIHLTPLDKVDEIVVVSEPMADLVRRIVNVPDTTIVRALPNLVDVERFDRPKNPIASRTVAVVGWAQQVKDPVWALEVLALLRRSDPDWRMIFVGNDFEARGSLAARAYKDRFRQRMLEEDVRDGVEFVGYSRDLPRVFDDVGFILSSSLRESFGVALMEGIASGAVPVVRDWPAFQAVDAARRITDPRWVVDDIETAAAAILRLGEESERAAEAAHAGQWLKEHVATEDVAAQYVAAVTGSAPNGVGAQ